jgi:hypothetical protein
MSFQEIQTNNIDLITINRAAYPPPATGINIVNNTLNARLAITGATATGQTTSLNTNGKFFFNPAIGTIFSGAPDHFITSATTYSSASLTVYAAALVGGIIVNNYNGATTYTLDTGSNLSTYAHPNGLGDTFCVYVCNAYGQAMTIEPPGDGSITVVNTTSPATSFVMVFQYENANTWNCYF